MNISFYFSFKVRMEFKIAMTETPTSANTASHIFAIPSAPRIRTSAFIAGLCIYNLGTGHGYSVLDIVKNFEKATGVKIPYVIKPRRPGDIATCYCDPTKAKEELGWEAQYGIEDMCADSWRWQKNNPNGYDD